MNSHTVDIRLHSATDNIDDLRILVSSVPEPGSLLLLASALAVVFWWRRKNYAQGAE